MHLAVGWPAGEGRNAVVEIRDQTLPDHAAVTGAFWFTDDEPAALRLADRNLRPKVTVLP